MYSYYNLHFFLWLQSNFCLCLNFLDKQHYLVETLARCASKLQSTYPTNCTTDLWKERKNKENKPTDSCWHAKLRRFWRYINVIPKIHHTWTIFAEKTISNKKEHIKRALFGNRKECVGYILNIEQLTVTKE